jgi:RNA helicase
MKEDTRLEGPFEYGIKPVKVNNKADWEEVKEKAKKGELDKIPAEIYVKHYSQLRLIAKDHQINTNRTESRDCRWYYGKAGAGKTRRAVAEFPEAYMKLSNKWWDGYQGQQAVILDDLDPKVAACLT